MITNNREQYQEEQDVAVLAVKEHEIILFNDDVNTFDFVIDTLIEVCNHSPEQAEQCTILVHYKGKCGVQSGDYQELIPKCNKLLSRGLSAEIC